MAALITLTTDFGTRDPYVAAMKGVIAGISPSSSVRDLSHEIDAQDVLEGALFLAGAVPYFPEGTIHVVVVDPGVGTERRPIAAKVRGQIIICPDNGLLTLLAESGGLEAVRCISNPAVTRKEISYTFHGRDVFAPAAAHLAEGVEFDRLGESWDQPAYLEIPRARIREDGSLAGGIIHIDRFGNAITNIHCAMLAGFHQGAVEAGDVTIQGLSSTYGDGRSHEPLALVGSSGYLEIAVNRGSAAKALGLAKGMGVCVR